MGTATTSECELIERPYEYPKLVGGELWELGGGPYANSEDCYNVCGDCTGDDKRLVTVSLNWDPDAGPYTDLCIDFMGEKFKPGDSYNLCATYYCFTDSGTISSSSESGSSSQCMEGFSLNNTIRRQRSYHYDIRRESGDTLFTFSGGHSEGYFNGLGAAKESSWHTMSGDCLPDQSSEATHSCEGNAGVGVCEPLGCPVSLSLNEGSVKITGGTYNGVTVSWQPTYPSDWGNC